MDRNEIEFAIAQLRRPYLHLNAGATIKADDLSYVIGKLETAIWDCGDPWPRKRP